LSPFALSSRLAATALGSDLSSDRPSEALCCRQSLFCESDPTYRKEQTTLSFTQVSLSISFDCMTSAGRTIPLRNQSHTQKGMSRDFTLPEDQNCLQFCIQSADQNLSKAQQQANCLLLSAKKLTYVTDTRTPRPGKKQKDASSTSMEACT
jgi:hypothetical protein